MSAVTARAEEAATSVCSSQNIRVEVICTIADLAPYEDAWNRFADESPQAVPYLSYAWVVSWLETILEPGERWRCFLVLRGDELLAVRPVIASDVRLLGLRRPRLTPPTDLHTPGTGLLCRPDRAEEIVDLLTDAILSEFPNYYSFSHPRIQQDSPAILFYKYGARTGRPVLEQLDEYAYLPLGESYDAHMKSIDSKFARNINRLVRKFSNLDPTVEFVTEPSRNRECLQRFMELEASGWKGGPDGGAILLSPKLIKFYARLTERLAKLGWMEWCFMEAEDKTIAAYLGVRCAGVLGMMKIAYNEAYAAYSPGMVMVDHMLRRAYQTRPYKAINFQSNGKWQKSWGSESRKYYTLTVYPPRIYSLVRGYLPRRIRIEGRKIGWLAATYRALRGQGTKRKKRPDPPTE